MAKDRLKPYFEELLKDYAFDEFSENFLRKIKAEEILKGVPLPIKAEELVNFELGKGEITVIGIARETGLVLGAAPDFPYAEAYRKFLLLILGGAAKTVKVLESEGSRRLTEKDPMGAAAYFRAVLGFDATSQKAMYGYALCCREIYEASEDEEKTGDFKAEFIELIEKLTVLYPEFAFAYYYLGYIYLNMGLYKKTQLAWEKFIRYIKDDPAHDEAFEEINEIKERLTTLEDPVKIEQAILDLTSGRVVKGLEVLREYENSEYRDWWPLHYYLGAGYADMGLAEEAIASLKHALTLSPSNTDIMEELVSIYHDTGDEANAAKYRDKINLLSTGQ